MFLTYVHSYQLLWWTAWYRSPIYCEAVTRMLSLFLTFSLKIIACTWACCSSLSLADAEELTIRKVTRSFCPNQQHSQWLKQLKLSLGNSCQAQCRLTQQEANKNDKLRQWNWPFPYNILMAFGNFWKRLPF